MKIAYERFSEQNIKIMLMAADEARIHKVNTIDTLHILVGILREGKNTAAKELMKQGVDLDTLKPYIPFHNEDWTVDFLMSDTLQQAFVRAIEYADQFEERYIQPEYILLALLEQENEVARFLEDIGLDPNDLIAAIVGDVTELNHYED